MPEATLLPRAPANRSAVELAQAAGSWRLDERGPSAVSLVMCLLLVHLEVSPGGHVLLSEPWEQGKYPSAFLGTPEGSGGLIPHIPESLCKGAGFQADSSVIQVQKQGWYSHPGDPCRMTDWTAGTSTEQARTQADLRAKGMPYSPCCDHTSGFAPFNSWIIPLLRAQSCSS